MIILDVLRCLDGLSVFLLAIFMIGDRLFLS